MSLLNEIVRRTGMMPSEVMGLLPTIQRRYKVYSIPKKNGDVRWIAQPAREVKALQYAIMNSLLDQLIIHPSATAYREGLGLVANATPHIGPNAILKLDFESFFNSIKQADFETYLVGAMPKLSQFDVQLAGQICFWKPARRANSILSVGAPSSPIISNALLYELDEKLLEIATDTGANYTRYADDITFSHKSAGELWSIFKKARVAIIENPRPRLRLNDGKTKVFSPKNRRVVTGLTLSNDGSVSLGRDRKRRIQAASHHFLRGQLSFEQVRELGGWLAFAKEVEPDFLRRLQDKYECAVHLLVSDAISKNDRAKVAA